jgi:peptidoglycan biosynthesis protein MviN/MurJ (putative lipid II flippase)
VHGFFVLSDTKTPVKYGILCVFLDIALAIALLKPLGYIGIAGAFVISKTVKIALLGAILNRKLEGLFDWRTVAFCAKLGIASCAAWLSLKLLLGIDNSGSSLHTLAFDLMLPAGGALVVFIMCSHFLRIDEFRTMISLLRNRKAGISALYGEAE